jgi:hypothetical protein
MSVRISNIPKKVSYIEPTLEVKQKRLLADGDNSAVEYKVEAICRNVVVHFVDDTGSGEANRRKFRRQNPIVEFQRAFESLLGYFDLKKANNYLLDLFLQNKLNQF